MFTYFPMLCLALAAGVTLSWHEAGRRGLSQRGFLAVAGWSILAALAGSRLFHALFDGMWDWYRTEPWQLLAPWRGGQVFYGGLLFGVGTALLLAWKKGWRLTTLLDVVAPGIALGLSLGRVGCFLAGCCYGRPTTLPWGIQYGPGYPAFRGQVAEGLIDRAAHYCLAVHPTQLYEAAGAAVILAVLLVRSRRTTPMPGTQFLTLVLLYAPLRFGLEYLRADPRGTLWGGLVSTSQGLSLILALLAAGAWVGMRKGKAGA